MCFHSSNTGSLFLEPLIDNRFASIVVICAFSAQLSTWLCYSSFSRQDQNYFLRLNLRQGVLKSFSKKKLPPVDREPTTLTITDYWLKVS